MKRSLLLGLLFLLASADYLIAQTRINGCGLGTRIQIINGSETPGCSEEIGSGVVEFRALPFYMTYAIVVTDDDLNILAVTRNRKIDFSQLPGGNYRVYGLFYQGLLRAEVGMNANEDLLATGCFGFTENFASINAVQPDAGVISTASGLSKAFVCSNNPDISQTVEMATTSMDNTFAYVLTDKDNVVQQITTSNTIDFNQSTVSEGLIYGFSYIGDILLQIGDTLSESTELASACFDLSENAVEVEILNPMGGNISFVDGSTAATACESNIGTFEIELEAKCPIKKIAYSVGILC